MSRLTSAGVTAAALAALSSLFSCSKQQDSPAVPRETATVNATTANGSAAALGWQNFVKQVEAGTLADPYGQYVSKSVQVASTGSPRQQRPKRAGADLMKLPVGAETGPGDAQFIQPDDPDGGGGGGGGYYPPAYTFVSSEGQYTAPWDNSADFITDLKVVDDASYSYQFPWYNRLNLDLNKGAGGRYIYLTFHRGSGAQFAGSSAPLTRLSVLTRSFSGNYSVADHEPIWFGQWLTDHVQVAPLDLNEGAGGDYIYAFESRNTSFGAPIREVGVIASTNSNIQPPAGWERVGVDLNKGAGGDYIYLCVKR